MGKRRQKLIVRWRISENTGGVLPQLGQAVTEVAACCPFGQAHQASPLNCPKQAGKQHDLKLFGQLSAVPIVNCPRNCESVGKRRQPHQRIAQSMKKQAAKQHDFK
ncbi:MAG: hypothetical protein ACI4EJ_07425 [Bacteroides sp.]